MERTCKTVSFKLCSALVSKDRLKLNGKNSLNYVKILKTSPVTLSDTKKSRENLRLTTIAHKAKAVEVSTILLGCSTTRLKAFTSMR